MKIFNKNNFSVSLVILYDFCDSKVGKILDFFYSYYVCSIKKTFDYTQINNHIHN